MLCYAISWYFSYYSLFELSAAEGLRTRPSCVQDFRQILDSRLRRLAAEAAAAHYLPNLTSPYLILPYLTL